MAHWFNKKHDFKVGDKVKIVRKTESQSDGWTDTWLSPMNDYIGRESVIISSHGSGGLRLADIYFVWPWQSLELVDTFYSELFNKIRDIKV